MFAVYAYSRKVYVVNGMLNMFEIKSNVETVPYTILYM